MLKPGLTGKGVFGAAMTGGTGVGGVAPGTIEIEPLGATVISVCFGWAGWEPEGVGSKNLARFFLCFGDGESSDESDESVSDGVSVSVSLYGSLSSVSSDESSEESSDMAPARTAWRVLLPETLSPACPATSLALSFLAFFPDFARDMTEGCGRGGQGVLSENR